MPKLPIIKGKELAKKLTKLGFVEYRQRGSHLVMVNETTNKQVVIPIHNKPLKKGTLAAIIRQANLTIEEIIKA